MPNPVTFTYRNHKGAIEQRSIIPDALEWINDPGYNYQPGWFLSGRCTERKQRRSFALANIVLPPADERKFFKLMEFPHD